MTNQILVIAEDPYSSYGLASPGLTPPASHSVAEPLRIITDLAAVQTLLNAGGDV